MGFPLSVKPRRPAAAAAKALNLPRHQSSSNAFLRALFCTSPSAPSTDPEPSSQDPEAVRVVRPRRRNERPEPPLHVTICEMMAKRQWTTRLQNSIRHLLSPPHLDQELVLGVIRRAHQPDHALRFFRFIEKVGFRHNAATYGEIIPLLTRNAMLNHARCLILEDMPARGVPRDELMLASLIAGYGKARIPQEAVKLFRRMPDLGVQRTHVSYDSFFKAILCTGRVLMAKRVFNSMITEGVAPQLSTYNTLLWGFCLSSRMKTAVRFFADMKERGVLPNLVTYNTLLNGWVRMKKMDVAEQVFAEMSNVGFLPNVVSYNLMIKGYVSTERVADAMRLYKEMIVEKKLSPSEKTFAALMPGLCDDTKMIAEAREVFNEMAERMLTPKDKSVFFRLVSTLCTAGDLDGAVEVHRKVQQFKHVSVDTKQYGILIRSLCEGGKHDSAVQILDEILEKGAMLSPQCTAFEPTEYNPLIEYLCTTGSTKKAEAFFRQLMKKGVEDEPAFNNLIRGHATEGSLDAAFDIIKIMSRRGVPTSADSYEILVNHYLKKGEPADARTTLDSMMEQGHTPSAALFRSVMVALFDDGRVQTASRVMKSMVERGVKENMDMAHKILNALFMRGHVEEALGRIQLKVNNDCVPDLDALLISLCEKEKALEAHKLADFALERDYDVNMGTYDRVLEALYTEGHTLQAYSVLCKIKGKGDVVDKKAAEALIMSLNSQGNTKQADILSRMLSEQAPAVRRRKTAKVDAF